MIVISCIQQTWSPFISRSLSCSSFSSGEAWSILGGRVLHPGTNWRVYRPNQGCLPLNSSSPPLQGQEKGHYWALYHCLHMHRWRLWEQCVSTANMAPSWDCYAAYSCSKKSHLVESPCCALFPSALQSRTLITYGQFSILATGELQVEVRLLARVYNISHDH